MRKPSIWLTKVVPQQAGHLRLTWDDEITRDVDGFEWMQRPARVSTIGDANLFSQVSLVSLDGKAEWQFGLDFRVQALRMRADKQLAAKGTA